MRSKVQVSLGLPIRMGKLFCLKEEEEEEELELRRRCLTMVVLVLMVPVYCVGSGGWSGNIRLAGTLWMHESESSSLEIAHVRFKLPAQTLW